MKYIGPICQAIVPTVMLSVLLYVSAEHWFYGF